MALADLDDVKRALRLPPNVPQPDDDELQQALDAADSYVKKLIPPYDETEGTVKLLNVYADEQLPLPIPGATITAIRAYSPGGLLYPITRWLYSDYWSVVPDPSSRVQFETLEIDWEYTDGVPDAVRHGVAIIAAALWKQTPEHISGHTSERIGDYSYTISDSPKTWPPQSLELLKPFRRRRRVLVG